MWFAVRRVALLCTTLALVATALSAGRPVAAEEEAPEEVVEQPQRQPAVEVLGGGAVHPGDTVQAELSGFDAAVAVELAVCLDDLFLFGGPGAPDGKGCTPSTPVVIEPDGTAAVDYVIPAELEVTLQGKCGLTSWLYYGACSLVAFEGDPLVSVAQAALTMAQGGTASVGGHVVDDVAGTPLATPHLVSVCNGDDVPVGSGLSFGSEMSFGSEVSFGDGSGGSGMSFPGSPDCTSAEVDDGEFQFGSLDAGTYSVRAAPTSGSDLSFGTGGSGMSFGSGLSFGTIDDNTVGIDVAEGAVLTDVDVPLAEPGAASGPIGYRGASLAVAPEHPAWNDTVTISGSGFRPGREVNLGLCQFPTSIAIRDDHLQTCPGTTVTADEDGEASVAVPYVAGRFPGTCATLTSCFAVAHETALDGVGRWAGVTFTADGAATISGQVTLGGVPLDGFAGFDVCGPIGCSHSYGPTAFTLPAPAEGDYTITASTSLGWYAVSGSTTVTVSGDEPVTGVEVALDVSALPTGSISGRVEDPDGDPLPGAQVWACKVDGGPYCSASAQATTDESGDYHLGYLGDGTWRLVVDSTGLSFPSPTWLAVVSGGGATTGNDLILPVDIGSGSIEVSVVDVHGQPIEAWVSTCYPSGPTNTTSCRHAEATSGSGTLGLLPDGTYVVSGSAGDTHASVSATVTGGGATAVTIEMPLAPGEGSIAGTVRDAGGDPVAGTDMWFCAVDGEGCSAGYSGWTDEDGAYLRADLPDGTYEVTAGGLNSNTTVSTEVTVEAAADLTGVDLTLPVDFGSGSVTGTVTDLNDLPIDALLQACDGELCFTGWSSSWIDGGYVIPNLPDGTYDVTARSTFDDDVTSTRTGVEVSEGDATAGIDFQLPITTGAISGHVFDDGGQPMANAWVWACLQVVFACRSGHTDAAGAYVIGGLEDGLYTVTVYGPDGTSRVETSATVVGQGLVTDVDIHFHAPHPVPPGVTVGHVSGSDDGDADAPIYLGQPTPLSVEACPGAASATWSLDFPGTDGDAEGTLTEDPSGIYTASVPSDPDRSGHGTLTIAIDCPEGADVLEEIDVYIDPSGFVFDTEGTPIVGATVTLLRSTSALGPFVVVPDGSDVMSPLNRENPDQTDATGHFGWEVTAGFYKVTATKDGCHVVGDAENPIAESPVYEVPPPVVDVQLVLDCGQPSDETPPQATTTVSPTPNAAGWVNEAATVTLEASDEEGGSGLASVSLGDQSGTESPLAVTVETEGVTTVPYEATDEAGNTTSGTAEVKVDLTDPTVTITSPAAGTTVEQGTPVTASYTCDDTLSGIASCEGDVPDGASIDTSFPSTKALTVTATDLAGNTTTVTHTLLVTPPVVPPDEVTMRFAGAIRATYESDGTDQVDVTIRRSGPQVVGAHAQGTVPGPGGPAAVRISVERLWSTSVFVGTATLADPSASLYQVTPIAGGVRATGSTVSGTSPWFTSRFAPYSLRWSMTDEG